MKFKTLVQDHSSSLPWINILKLIIFTLLIVGIPVSAHAAKVTNFIPAESFVYVQLKDIDEVYSEIEISENWEKTRDLLIDKADWQQMQQGLLMAQGIVRTDVFGLIDTVGYQTGFALWKSETDTVQGGFVVHSGGNLAELQRLTKILTGFIGLSEGTLKLNAGEYRGVKYNTLQLQEVLFTYGFVSDFLVVGIEENSFEKLIDTYRKRVPSIQKSISYSKASKKFGEGQLSVSINVSEVLPLVEDMDANVRVQLETFKNVYAKLNLLDTKPLLQIYTEFDPTLLESKIGPFLQEGGEMEILKSLPGEEDLFIAVAPSCLENVWQLAQIAIENAESDEAYAFITFLEGILNLNFEEDVIAGLTGEIALSVDDLTLFDPNALESLELEIDNNFEIDAANVDTLGSLIFFPSNRLKWDQISNSLSNLQNTSVSHTNYKGTKVAMFASNIYYAERDGLALLSFSEDQMYSIVDELQAKKKPSYLKRLPKNPLVVVKLNIAKLLELINGAMQIENDVVPADEIFPILAWITVKENEAVLEVTLSEKESPLEILIKFAPFIASHLKN